MLFARSHWDMIHNMSDHVGHRLTYGEVEKRGATGQSSVTAPNVEKDSSPGSTMWAAQGARLDRARTSGHDW